MPNTAPGFDKNTVLTSATYPFAQGKQLREPREPAAKAFLEVINRMEGNKALAGLMKTLPPHRKIEFSEVASADSTKVLPALTQSMRPALKTNKTFQRHLQS